MEILAYAAVALVFYFGITALVLGLCRAASDADDEILGDLQYSDDLERHVQILKTVRDGRVIKQPIPAPAASQRKQSQPARERRRQVSQA